MTPEQILEIALRYDCLSGSEPYSRLWVGLSQEDTIAFAQAVIEAEREKRKPLTDEEIRPLLYLIWEDYESTQQSTTEVVRAIENKIWEKNA